MKKMTTFVCVAAITASLLAGCGSKTAETTAASTEAAAVTEAASTEAAVEGTDADKEAAKKVGLAVAQRAKDKGIEAVVFDRGGYIYHGRVAALADGAREGGLAF